MSLRKSTRGSSKPATSTPEAPAAKAPAKAKFTMPANVEDVLATAKALGGTTIYINPEGEFFWNEKLANKVFKGNYQAVKILDLKK